MKVRRKSAKVRGEPAKVRRRRIKVRRNRLIQEVKNHWQIVLRNLK
jgi:hypothetical protein